MPARIVCRALTLSFFREAREILGPNQTWVRRVHTSGRPISLSGFDPLVFSRGWGNPGALVKYQQPGACCPGNQYLLSTFNPIQSVNFWEIIWCASYCIVFLENPTPWNVFFENVSFFCLREPLIFLCEPIFCRFFFTKNQHRKQSKSFTYQMRLFFFLKMTHFPFCLTPNNVFTSSIRFTF